MSGIYDLRKKVIQAFGALDTNLMIDAVCRQFAPHAESIVIKYDLSTFGIVAVLENNTVATNIRECGPCKWILDNLPKAKWDIASTNQRNCQVVTLRCVDTGFLELHEPRFTYLVRRMQEMAVLRNQLWTSVIHNETNRMASWQYGSQNEYLIDATPPSVILSDCTHALVSLTDGPRIETSSILTRDDYPTILAFLNFANISASRCLERFYKGISEISPPGTSFCTIIHLVCDNPRCQLMSTVLDMPKSVEESALDVVLNNCKEAIKSRHD